MSTVNLTVGQWKSIREALHEEYPKSVFMLRDKMKTTLGFTVREHTEWIPKLDGGYTDYSIRLDFYNEKKYTMFLLKYSEYLNG
jgi:hypothetical protein